jgi:hypothetical protein
MTDTSFDDHSTWPELRDLVAADSPVPAELVRQLLKHYDCLRREQAQRIALLVSSMGTECR